MSMMGLIIAEQEDFDQIYREFAEDLKKYLVEMNNDIANVLEIVDSLSKYWTSDYYISFRDSIRSGMERVEEELSRGENIRKIMIDQEQKLAEAIAKLKEENGDI